MTDINIFKYALFPTSKRTLPQVTISSYVSRQTTRLFQLMHTMATAYITLLFHKMGKSIAKMQEEALIIILKNK